MQIWVISNLSKVMYCSVINKELLKLLNKLINLLATVSTETNLIEINIYAAFYIERVWYGTVCLRVPFVLFHYSV